MAFHTFIGGTVVPAHQHPNGGGWVADTAKVSDTAFIAKNAEVYEKAVIQGNARIYGYAKVSGNALVGGSAHIYENAQVCGDAQVYGHAEVYGISMIKDHAVIGGLAVIKSAEITGTTRIMAGHIAGLVITETPFITLYGSDTLIKTDTHLVCGQVSRSIKEWFSIPDTQIKQETGPFYDQVIFLLEQHTAPKR